MSVGEPVVAEKWLDVAQVLVEQPVDLAQRRRLVEAMPPNAWHPRRRTCHSRDAGVTSALQLEGTYPMMYYLAAFLPVVGITALATVYLVSKDADLRDRAWRLLQLLLRR
jgi:hypothetical protein